MPLLTTIASGGVKGLGWSAASASEELGGMVLLTPTSIDYTGTSATVGTNGSVEFTAVSSLSLNGVFSADYDNYMIVHRANASAPDNVSFKFRQSGTDSSTGYTQQLLTANSTNVTGSRSTTVAVNVSAVYGTQRAGFVLNVYGPFLSQPTAMRSAAILDFDSAAIRDTAATHSVVDSYDGFTTYMGGQNMTGLVSVYGIRGA